MSKVNKIVRISLAGGIIGMLTTNPRKAIDDTIFYPCNKYCSSNSFLVVVGGHRSGDCVLFPGH